MKNLITALAVVTTFLVTGQAAAKIIDENVLNERRSTRISERVMAGTGSEMKRLDPTVSSGAKAIVIFLGIQEAFLTESGVVMKTYRISSGAPSTPTPVGVFQIYQKEKLRVSSQAVAYRMPNYMAFTENDAYGLHGLPYLGDSSETSAYWNEALSHIGIPVSHGCVRFLPEEAVEIYQWADVGIPVIIQN